VAVVAEAVVVAVVAVSELRHPAAVRQVLARLPGLRTLQQPRPHPLVVRRQLQRLLPSLRVQQRLAVLQQLVVKAVAVVVAELAVAALAVEVDAALRLRKVRRRQLLDCLSSLWTANRL